ncbi:MAG: hypothetical protein KIS29_09830 [Thermoplasmata archaeon]|nr:hypothetical protein [Candidatus Sysuiplasma jiujiangense]
MRPLSFLIGLFLLLFIGYEVFSGHTIQELDFLSAAGSYVSGGYLHVSTTYTILFVFLTLFAIASFLYGLGSSGAD